MRAMTNGTKTASRSTQMISKTMPNPGWYGSVAWTVLGLETVLGFAAVLTFATVLVFLADLVFVVLIG